VRPTRDIRERIRRCQPAADNTHEIHHTPRGENLMRIPVARKAVFLVLICMVIAGLIISIVPGVNAQSQHGTFIDLLKPYVNKEVIIGPSSGSKQNPLILKEIGVDYILVETPQGVTHAISVSSISSLTLGGERLVIHSGGY
jgi:hypothetical protein